jgi:hypothetical protein
MRNLEDALLTQEKALPNGAASTYSDPIDLGASSARASFEADTELVIRAPELATAKLPDGQTITYDVEQAEDEAFTVPATLFDNVIVQTGAGAAGAAASEVRRRLPSDVKQYVRLKATKTGAADASAAAASIRLVF